MYVESLKSLLVCGHFDNGGSFSTYIRNDDVQLRTEEMTVTIVKPVL